MKSERRVVGKAVLFVVLFAILAVLSGSVGCASAAIYVPDNYTTIQQAVNVAGTGDTIIVRDNIYSENVDVFKSVTIQSENGPEYCIVQAANSDDHVFDVTADYVNISGFTVTGATGDGKAGIYLNSVAHCNISNNNASVNHHGIKLDSSNNNMISNNNASYNTNHGLRLEESSYNNVTGNTLLSNNNHGIWMESSNNNTIKTTTHLPALLVSSCSIAVTTPSKTTLQTQIISMA